MKRNLLSVCIILALCVAISPITFSKSRATKKGTRAVAQKSSRAKTKARTTQASRSKSTRGAKAIRNQSKYARGSRRARNSVQAQRPRRVEDRSNEAFISQTIPAPSVPRSASGIPAERVAEIQNALVKSGYLTTEFATGQYDYNTVEAMKRFQSKNSLPQTGMPSAFTLKRLGVSKSANNGYAIPVNRVKETEKKTAIIQNP